MMRRILITRPAGQAGELGDLLEARGFAVDAVPTVEIDMASAAPHLGRMIDTLESAAWLVLTSANGARAVADHLAATGRRLPEGLRVAAVGAPTASVLRAGGIGVDHVPGDFLTVAISDGLGDVNGLRVVLARADAATPALRDALVAQGATVDEVVAYRTIEGPASSRDAVRAALHSDPDGIAFTSSSTVRGLFRLASRVDRPRARAMPAFCIGPVTAETARLAGLRVAAVAVEHTALGLANAIADHFAAGDR